MVGIIFMSEQALSIDPKLLRNALGNFATGITVITAQSTSGQKVGVTANSFNSLSMDPPLILWSLDKRAGSYAIFSEADYFAVNVLSSDQMDKSNNFASKQEDKFSDVDYEEGLGGAPLLFGCAARFQCKVYQKIDAGDHWLFIGEVEKFDEQAKPPLCYHKGGYSILYPHPGMNKTDNSVSLQINDNKKLSNNILYLMLAAAQSYQQGYIPQQESLGLNSISSRIIMNLNDKISMSSAELSNTVFAPKGDIESNLTTLEAQQYIKPTHHSGEGYTLTEEGILQANKYWALVEHYQTNVLKSHSEKEVESFKSVLNTIMGK